ncbi:MAG TPA: hypothetical protein VJ323_06250, partial [Bryobacteraceae bacterium]|nr:hypothetical protein [Bryobacteraceae bacterium]
MSEQPPVSSPSFFSRKIGGIPVLYLVGGFVVVLAVIAWRMKPNSVASEEPAMSADDPFRSDANIRNEDDSPLPPIPVGTVVAPVQGTPANPDQGNAAIQTNTDWLKAGVEFLVSKKQGPAEAQRALSTYLDGTDMTMAQQAMVDQVIAEYG